jgi:hypothetical protein
MVEGSNPLSGGVASPNPDTAVEMKERGGLPPGPSAPGAVQTLEWMYRPIEFMERCRRRYGPISAPLRTSL